LSPEQLEVLQTFISDLTEESAEAPPAEAEAPAKAEDAPGT